MAVWSEVSINKLSPTSRLDPEYYQPRFLENIDFLTNRCIYKVTTLGEMITSISGGATPLGAEYPDEGIPFLRVQNIMPGYLNLNDVVYIFEETHNDELERSKLSPDDVVFTITGSYGNAAYVPPTLGEANINQHSVRMAFKPDVLPEYVTAFLNCRFGRLQSDMKITGITRPALDYGEIRTFLLPILPMPLQEEVRNILHKSERTRQHSQDIYTEAEHLLLHELGLDTLDLSHELTYERNFSEVAVAERFDAQYFAPRYQRAMKIMARSGQTLGSVAPLAKRFFRSVADEPFNYIEIGNLVGSGHAESEVVMGIDAPSRAQWVVEAGDVITSTVRPIRRLTALIEPEQHGFVCSSGFAVLEPRDIAPELLTVYLRLPIVSEVLDLHTTATMYPAIATDVLLNIPISQPSKSATTEIVNKVQQSRQAREQAKQLLEEAKRRVEQMILGEGASHVA